MASNRRRVADDGRQTLGKIRRNVAKGTVETLFEDENFVFELIDVLHEDGVDVTVKTEFLSILEQYGSDHLDGDRAEQVAMRLLDVLQEHKSHSECPRLLVQLMLTVTTLLIQNDMLKTELTGSLVTQLWDMVCRVNDVATRRLRGCACQCLRQLETWKPGLLSRYKDRLVQAMREERTHVFQDYATLLSTVLTSLSHSSAKGDTTYQQSISVEEVVPPLSYLMDNAFLFTPSGLWPIVTSVTELVKTTVHVSPTILKPLMLQNLASLDPCMLHIVLYCQREFHGEILTAEEEHRLIQRLTSEVRLLTLHPAQRLLILQWLKAYLQHNGREILLDGQFMAKLQHALRPTLFDSLDIHIDKLNVLTHSYPVDQDQNLLNDIHYLKRLSLTTGNERAAVGLYRILFAAYTHHQTQRVSDIVIKITRDLVVDYPHLIPLILDFLLAVKEAVSDSSVYLATLSSLHHQVLSAGQVEVLTQFRFYLQVLSVSAKQPDIQQQKTVQFLLHLVHYAEECGACEWELGCAVLTICRNLLMHHCSDYIYYDLGELLFEMQSCFSDSDIRNRARLFYALLAGASDGKVRDVLGCKLEGGMTLSKNITSILTGTAQNKGKAEIVHVDNSLLQWQKLSVSPGFMSLEAPSKRVQIPSAKGRLESYYRHLAHLDTHLVYQYKLSLTDASEYGVLDAVNIRLKSSTESFLPVPDLHLLSLTKLGSKEVEIRLAPCLPQPVNFNTEITFSTEDHMTVMATLQPLEVSFSDLTLKLPWQQLGVAGQQDQHCVFDDLWDLLTSSSEGERGQAVESVKVLKCTADKIRSALKDFHIPASSDQSVDKFLIFLPPSFHLLLRVYPQGTSRVVSIATDFWKVLPCVSNLLNSLEPSV